jgi:hypothetical protein
MRILLHSPAFLCAAALLFFGVISPFSPAQAQSTTGVNSLSGTPLYIGAGGSSTPFMTVGTNGNIGIGLGTTVPSAQLQLYSAHGGDLGIGQQNDNTPYMRLGMDTGWVQYLANNAYWTGTAYNYVSTGGYGGLATRIAQVSGTIEFDTASGGTNPIAWTGRLYIANNGNVGVGTTTPGNKLDIYSSTAKDLFIGPWDGGSNYNEINLNGLTGTGNYNIISSNGDQTLYLNRPSGGAMRFRENNADELAIVSGGAATFSNTVTATAYFHSSDARLKTDIHPIDHALDKMLALKGVTFNWKKDGHADMGVTAQNVSEVFPNAVSKNADGMMSVNTDSLVGPMIEAIRALKADNDALRSELNEIKESLKGKTPP